MARFIEGRDRDQAILFPERLDEAIGADNPVRVVDAFIDALDVAELGFDVMPEATGRPGYHPVTMLKMYLYGYLNQVQSSRRLERECQRNVEVMWLIGQLTPDFKTIADCRRDNGPAIRKVCSRFVALCRGLHLLDGNAVVIDGSKFKAVNHREKNFPKDRLAKRSHREHHRALSQGARPRGSRAGGHWRSGARRQGCAADARHRDAQDEARPSGSDRGSDGRLG